MANPYPHKYPDSRSGHLLHRLYALQEQFLHISPESVQQVAAEFNVPVSQVASVVEFYSFFYTQPRGRFHILFSNCTSCGYLLQEQNLMLMLCQQLQVTLGKTRQDGLISIDETSCIGMCDHGASLLVNGVPITGLNPDRIAQIARRIATETPVADWPTEWFAVHDTVHQRNLLLAEQFVSGSALQRAFDQGAESTLTAILQSGLRGRGGAGFDTGKKWQFCREAPGETRYVVCNADEGEPGTFKDRLLLHDHADALFEGMAVCAFIIGAEKGFVYLRGEYRYLLPHLHAALKGRRKQGLLEQHILGHAHFHFDIEIVVGAGAYICGEESALIESLEGKPGIPRIRPPFPVTHGYLNQPTVVNNVETLIAAAHITVHGSAWFKSVGTEKSSGSKILSVSGDCQLPGIYEYPFGVTIQQVLDDCGAQNARAVQIGGPAGRLIGAADFHHAISFEDVSTGGSFLVFGQQRDLLAIHCNFAHFFAHESCGFCVPCRVGTQLLKCHVDKIANGRGTAQDIAEMKQIGQLIERHSHCGLGHTAANHVLDGLQHFPQTFTANLQQHFTARFDLDQALEDARQITQRDAAAHLD
ncbi:NAD(P)H-dependent oxidoreductase subunit E [Nitrosomonas sp. Nm166]|uniref:NAD(P)H-dependent oxidoreductase subunit E n=1 Tax=Nitrosomonas sp. Nm166 TaxID=1881054 RepID=UPI0008E83097|nr:NAD(P)H-dependent oxidoreductase subunit E [Nitrosomonas sp. Nm166]SFE04641.1 [NiFe] hydrogenase diaphorase moiety large subunit [Nitrosomonas sp. Nm166]